MLSNLRLVKIHKDDETIVEVYKDNEHIGNFSLHTIKQLVKDDIEAIESYLEF